MSRKRRGFAEAIRQALRDEERSYNEAMTLLINDLLESLDVQPMMVAQRVAQDAKGFQSRGIRKLVAKDRITPEVDFKTIMDFIEQDALGSALNHVRQTRQTA